MKRHRVTIDTSPQVLEALDAMLATGLYGLSRAHVAERLLAGAVARELAQGLLGRVRPDLRPGLRPRGRKRNP